MAGSDWADENYEKRKKVTINNSMVSGSLVDFPILLYSSQTELQNIHPSATVFYDSGNNNTLAYEIEYWNSGAGELSCWIKMPKISSGTFSGNVFWMYYDYPGASTSTENPTDVWDDNFIFVMHCDDASGGLRDSTSNGNNFTSVIGSPLYQYTDPTDSLTHYAVSGDGTNDYFYNSSMDLTALNSGSFEVWFKYKDIGASESHCLFGSRWIAAGLEDIRMIYNRGATGTGDSGPNLYWDSDDAGAPFGHHLYTYDTTTTWDYLASVITNAGSGYVYSWYNGHIYDTETPVSYSFTGLDDDVHYIGARGYASTKNPWRGQLDEIRLSKTDRSHAWIKTTHMAISGAKKGFLTFGDEETKPTEEPPPTISPELQIDTATYDNEIYIINEGWIQSSISGG